MVSRIVGGSTADEARATVNFYGADGNIVETFYVKNSDTLDEIKTIVFDPGVGTLEDNEIFRGWSINNSEYTKNSEPKTIEDVRKYLEETTFTEATDEAAGTVVNIYPMIFKTFTVNYLGEKNVALGATTILLNANETSVEYTVNMAYTPSSSYKNFEGWNVTSGSSNIEGYVSGTIYKNNTDITIKGNVTFSVEAPEGFWLVFDEVEKGATYNAPQFVKGGELPKRPRDDSEMHLVGFTFDDWYTSKDYTEKFDFTKELTDNTTAYARWIPNTTAEYTVLIWKQNVGNKKDAQDSEKTYDFGEAITLTGTVGQTVNTVSAQGSGNNRYARINNVNKQYTGFHLNKFDQNVTISEKGNTIVNVYYDRNLVTLTFQVMQGSQVQIDNKTINGYNLRRVNYNQYVIEINGKWYEITSNGSRVWDADEIINVPTPGSGNITYTYEGFWDWYPTERSDAPVSGTEFTFPTSANQTMTGLYGQTLESQGYTWPTNYDWYDSYRSRLWGYEGAGTRTTFLDAFILSNGSSDQTFYGFNSSGGGHAYFYKKNASGDYVLINTVSISEGANFYISDKYNGYKPVEYRKNNSSGWTPLGEKDSQTGYYATVTNVNNLYIHYDPVTYNLLYKDGVYVDGNGNPAEGYESRGTLKTEEKIPFESDMSAYNEGGNKAYKPTFNNFVFAGWYIDEKCTQEYTFTTMPEGLTVYAKWILVQYRVFLHPNADTDSTLIWGVDEHSQEVSQDMNFRVSNGSKVSTPTGKRSDYEMVGWYMDEDCTEVFNASAFVLNDESVPAEPVYDKTKDFTDPMDKWGNGATENHDVDRFWITRKLDLYAKWRKVLIGADGIGVVYDATDKGENAPTDPTLYLDGVNAVAQAASTAKSEDEQFLYWYIQKWDEDKGEFVDTEETVYPGDSFTVLRDNARIVENEGSTEQNPSYTYTVRLRAEYGPKEQATPTYINWYKNDGKETKPIREDKDLKINQAVNILAAQTREGYKFLGWARMPEFEVDEQGEATSDTAIVDYPNLTKDDLFLKYVEPESGEAYFEGRNSGSEAWVKVTQVAADERKPYHALYAVWERKPVTLTIQKQLEGSIEYVEMPTAFEVTVTIQDANNELEKLKELNESIKDEIKIEDGKATITVSIEAPAGTGKENITSSQIKLLAGMTYKIVEKEYKGFTADYENQESAKEGVTADETKAKVTNTAQKVTPAGLDLDTTAARIALLSLFAFAMMCVLGFSLKRKYASRR